MFLLDTNVISELRKSRKNRKHPHFNVWADGLDMRQCYLSAVTIFEIEAGIVLLEQYDLRQASILRNWLEEEILSDFEERVLPVDVPIARRAASLRSIRTFPDNDAYIAATALTYGMPVVTRNVSDFDGTGVIVLNPWIL